MASAHKSIFCVDNPEISEVFDFEAGEIYTAQQAIGSDYDKLEKLRMELSESVSSDNPKYLCPICHVGIYLVCRIENDKKKFFFRHSKEDDSCPAITRSNLSKDEIEARKYNGVKESPAHFHIKHIVAESLKQDPNFSEVKVEEVWRGQDRSTWRKPDVQAIWKGSLPVAFEIQLSTTFLHVIAQRRLFYKAEGGLLCWIFKSFGKTSSRMTQDDVFYNNNHNLFLASDDTLKASKESGSFIIDCHWTEPASIDGIPEEIWKNRYTSFDELTLDTNRQRLYFFDYDSQKPSLVEKANKDALKQRFFSWWISHKGEPSPNDENWSYFQKEFRSHGVYMPEYPSEISTLLKALYSAREGRSVGWGHDKFISVVHLVANLRHEKNILQTFRVALLVYNRAKQIRDEDKEGKWLKKSKEIRKSIYTDKAYERDRKFDSLISFLFPEVMDQEKWAQLKAWDEKIISAIN